MKPFFIVLFALLPVLGYTQNTFVSKEIKTLFFLSCAICREHPADSSRFIQDISTAYTADEINYHNCHFYCSQDLADSAYKYSLLLKPDPKNNNNPTLVNHCIYIKAAILFQNHLYAEALPSFLFLLSQKKIEEVIKVNTYSKIGACYLQLNEYTQSLKYLNQCLKECKVIDPLTLKNIYTNMGLGYVYLNKMKESDTFFQKGIAVCQMMKDTPSLAMVYINIANRYYNNYEDKKAVGYFNKALELGLLANDADIQQHAYYNLAVIAENSKEYLPALENRKKYESEHDTVFNQNKIWSLVQEEKKLAIKEQEHKTELEQKKNQLQSLELSKQRQQIYLFTFLAFTFLFFFAFAFYAYKQKNKQNIIISAQREELDVLNHTKDQVFSVVAHDLRSPVQTMKATLYKLRTALHDKNISGAEQISGEIESISNGTYSLLNNLLYWALSQTGQLHFAQDKLNIRRLVEQVFYDYAAVAAAKDIRLENGVAEDLHGSGDMNTVKIILRNLVDNAIKFSPSFTPVIVSGHVENGKCMVAVLNGGKGIDESIIQALANKNTKRVGTGALQGQSTGIGLWLVKTMAERNGGSLRIERSPEGTKMNVHLPQYRNHEQTKNTDS